MGVRSKFFDPRSVKTAARTAKGDVWHKLSPWLVILLVAGVLVLVVMVFQSPLRKNQQLIARKDWLQKQIEQQKAVSIRMEDELNALQNDPYYIERMARDILKYGRVGEVIFKFPQDLSDTGNPSAKPGAPRRR
jgi:cell division protein FtsB